MCQHIERTYQHIDSTAHTERRRAREAGRTGTRSVVSRCAHAGLKRAMEAFGAPLVRRNRQLFDPLGPVLHVERLVFERHAFDVVRDTFFDRMAFVAEREALGARLGAHVRPELARTHAGGEAGDNEETGSKHILRL